MYPDMVTLYVRLLRYERERQAERHRLVALIGRRRQRLSQRRSRPQAGR